MSFGNFGAMGTHGNSSFFGAGKSIYKNGDTYYCGGKSYYKCGNSLWGPNGKSWYGVGEMTDQDIRNIIASDN